jgi:phosphoribosylanthranilate isomerase
MAKVKVCGITNLKDALAAEKAGADIIGFIFAKSPRKVKPAVVKRICSALKLSTMKAGVFVNENADKVNAFVRDFRLNIVQLSGDETPSYMRKIRNVKIIRSIHVKDGKNLKKQVKKFGTGVYAFLFDTYDKKKYGGTGRVFNWTLVKKTGVPFFIAGGLNPGNVKDAIKNARPFGVDVSSGIESRPGRKDLKKLRDFLKAVKS